MTYHPGAPLFDVAPCKPTRPGIHCPQCARRAESIPSNPINRPTVVLLDVSRITKADICPLRMPARWVKPQEIAA